MAIRKIEAGRVITQDLEHYVGTKGTIFYDEFTGEFRLSDGRTPGGILLSVGGGGGGGNIRVTVSEINSANTITNEVTDVSAFRFDKDTGFKVEDLGNGEVKISLGSSFKTWKIDGQQDLVAVGEDTIKFVAGPGIILTTDPNASTQTLTISVDTATITTNKVADIPVVITTATNGDGLVYQNGTWVNAPTMVWASRNW